MGWLDDLGVVGNGISVTSEGGGSFPGGCLRNIGDVKTMLSSAKLSSSTWMTRSVYLSRTESKSLVTTVMGFVHSSLSNSTGISILDPVPQSIQSVVRNWFISTHILYIEESEHRSQVKSVLN